MFNLEQKKRLKHYYVMFKKDIELKKDKIENLISSNSVARGNITFIATLIDLHFKKNDDTYEIFLSGGTSFVNLFKDIYLENEKEFRILAKKCNEYFFNYLDPIHRVVTYNQTNDDSTLITYQYDIVAYDFNLLFRWLDRNGYDQNQLVFEFGYPDLPDRDMYNYTDDHICFVHKEGNEFTGLGIRDNKIILESNAHGSQIQQYFDITDYEKAISKYNSLSGQRLPTTSLEF